ncbi:hypothetical protein R6138_04344 [Ralstonia thomasii]|uniref:hypothetical protein n=1 Tax=Ralstonia thomasii TaxID=3058596 RepID=UPI0028F68264|nr:hypothetical protein [Ralstonia sp. LMG 18095]CAJ0899529.1 hypothetical protein R6138_04344 [Ralstonia sp. LMG 18095]
MDLLITEPPPRAAVLPVALAAISAPVSPLLEIILYPLVWQMSPAFSKQAPHVRANPEQFRL